MANFANESKPSYYYHMNPKISMREKVGYSLGDVAANLVFQMMMIFQLKFYTDIFGLDGAVAGSVLLIARVADAFLRLTDDHVFVQQYALLFARRGDDR